MAYQETRREFLIDAIFFTAGMTIAAAGLFSPGCKSNESSAQDSKQETNIPAELDLLDVRFRQGVFNAEKILREATGLAVDYFCTAFSGQYFSALSPLELKQRFILEPAPEYLQKQNGLLEQVHSSLIQNGIAYTDPLTSTTHMNQNTIIYDKDKRLRSNPAVFAFSIAIDELHHAAAPTNGLELGFVRLAKRLRQAPINRFQRGAVTYIPVHDNSEEYYYQAANTSLEAAIVVQSTWILLNQIYLPMRSHREIDLTRLNRLVETNYGGNFNKLLNLQQKSIPDASFEGYED